MKVYAIKCFYGNESCSGEYVVRLFQNKSAADAWAEAIHNASSECEEKSSAHFKKNRMADGRAVIDGYVNLIRGLLQWPEFESWDLESSYKSYEVCEMDVY